MVIERCSGMTVFGSSWERNYDLDDGFPLFKNFHDVILGVFQKLLQDRTWSGRQVHVFKLFHDDAILRRIQKFFRHRRWSGQHFQMFSSRFRMLYQPDLGNAFMLLSCFTGLPPVVFSPHFGPQNWFNKQLNIGIILVDNYMNRIWLIPRSVSW